MLGNQLNRYASEVVSLAAGKNGGKDLLRIGSRKQKLHMFGRLLESFEQGVEGRRREHVDFVDNVNFEFSAGRSVLARLAKLSHLLDAIVARAVDLENIQRSPFGDF